MRLPIVVCLVAAAFLVRAGAYHRGPANRHRQFQRSVGQSHPRPERRAIPRRHGRPEDPGSNHGARSSSTQETPEELRGHCDYRLSWYLYNDWHCFRCVDPQFAGEGVPSPFVRDGYADCADGSDEMSRLCNSDDDCFRCTDGSGEVNAVFKCDNIYDCFDGSDEDSCYWPTSDVYTCYRSGDQIDMFFACDNYDDCSDGSDEYCFRGSTGEIDFCDDDCLYSVLYEDVCDGKNDSYDGRDEQDCFHCLDGLWSIWIGYVLDNYEDCHDGSDERSTAAPEVNVNPPIVEEPTTTDADSCQWLEWSGWSACSNDCGAGTTSRTRQCVCQTTGCTSKADMRETTPCLGSSCPAEASGGCGTRQPSVAQGRIVGGYDAEAGDWPWQAQLLYRSRFKCGGTLYKNKYIISAAHCFDGKEQASSWSVRLGNLDTPGASRSHQSGVAAILRPPGQAYNSLTFDNDIVALELVSPVAQTSSTVSNICVDAGADKTFDSSSNCYITGFGLLEDGGQVASHLQAAHVPYISSQDCKQYNGASINSNMLCAGYPALGGVDACQGDSGGPLVCTAPDDPSNPLSPARWYLVGVTSWGYGCAQVGRPGVYADVSKYRAWLDSLD